MVRIAINGFGRIGRAAFKIALEHSDKAEVVAVNDLGNIENLAYLLRYDSVYGRYSREVTASDNALMVGDKKITVLNESDPTKLPWKEMEVDVVIESTGVFTTKEKAEQHLTAGAKAVVISAPSKSDGVATVVMGVNDKDLTGKNIVSNASCTTNCVTPIMAVLGNIFGIEKALLTTAHAYTATQGLVDGPVRDDDFRRGRAGAVNMVPSTTGAAVASAMALPELSGRFDGVALRVPVPVVSMSDFSVLLKKDATAEEVNQAFIEAVDNPLYKGVINVTNDQTVSSDFIGDPHSAIIDLSMTLVVGGNLVKVMAWYDNEWGYSNRLVEQVITLGENG